MNFVSKIFHTAQDLHHTHSKAVFYDKMYREYASKISFDKCRITPEQEKETVAYWRDLTGKKIDLRWHKILYALTGTFSKRYIPFEVYSKVIESLSPSANRAFDHKGLYSALLHNFQFPERVALRTNGVYYVVENGTERETTQAEFLDKIRNVEDAIIKPSFGTDGGRGVTAFHTKEGVECGSGKSVGEFVGQFGSNFVIEKKFHEASNLQKLNASSCNTLRVHTFRDREEGRCKFLSAYIRIGKEGEVVDNAYSGGICAKIDASGNLDNAVSCYPYKVYTIRGGGYC